MVNNIPEEMMPETFIVPITVPPVTYAKVIIQGDNITIEPRLKTNADRIRAMTDEELSLELYCIAVDNWYDGMYRKPLKHDNPKYWYNWLKQEAK